VRKGKSWEIAYLGKKNKKKKYALKTKKYSYEFMLKNGKCLWKTF